MLKVARVAGTDFLYSIDWKHSHPRKKPVGAFWYCIGRKKPFFKTTYATAELVVLVLEQNNHDLIETYDKILYDNEASRLLETYIEIYTKKGWMEGRQIKPRKSIFRTVSEVIESRRRSGK